MASTVSSHQVSAAAGWCVSAYFFGHRLVIKLLLLIVHLYCSYYK